MELKLRAAELNCMAVYLTEYLLNLQTCLIGTSPTRAKLAITLNAEYSI